MMSETKLRINEELSMLAGVIADMPVTLAARLFLGCVTKLLHEVPEDHFEDLANEVLQILAGRIEEVKQTRFRK